MLNHFHGRRVVVFLELMIECFSFDLGVGRLHINELHTKKREVRLVFVLP